MEIVLPFVTEPQQKYIQQIVGRIIELAMPEKIICYGIRSMTSEQWSSFSNDGTSEPNISIDLLIILQEKDKRKRESVSDTVENLSNDNIRLIPIVHSMDAVNINLEQGNPFFRTLCSNGVLVYDRNRVPFSIPCDEGFNETFFEANQRKSDLAQMFLETANDCATEGRNDVAVFMLHQAVELKCIALLRTCLGYRPTTHSIKKLFALIENISLDVHLLFPRSTDQEIELFNILQGAYSDVRYKEKYTVSADHVLILLERVRELLLVSAALCEKQSIKHSGSSTTNNHIAVRDIAPFDSIALDIPFDVVLQKGENECISIESINNMADIVQCKVDDNRLRIWIKNDSVNIIPYATIYINYSTLNGLVVHDSGNITCREPIECEFLGIIQNGKGNINLQVDVSNLDATLTKSGCLKISGTSDQVSILNTGTATFDGIDLEASAAVITIKGTGGISAHVVDELRTHLEGDGSLILKGEPRLKTFSMN